MRVGRVLFLLTALVMSSASRALAEEEFQEHFTDAKARLKQGDFVGALRGCASAHASATRADDRQLISIVCARAAAGAKDRDAFEEWKRGAAERWSDCALCAALDDEMAKVPSAREPWRSTSVDGGGSDDLVLGELRAGWKAVLPRVTACFAPGSVPAQARVNVAIAASGRVSSAALTGAAATQGASDCVSKAARAARFKLPSGFAESVSFPIAPR